MVSVSRLQLPSVLSVGFGVSVLGWVVVRFPDAGWGAIVLMPLGTFALLTVVAGVVGYHATLLGASGGAVVGAGVLGAVTLDA